MRKRAGKDAAAWHKSGMNNFAAEPLLRKDANILQWLAEFCVFEEAACGENS
jgi:hypothetical protein